MKPDVSSFVERYQLIYEKDPESKVFAPLAEAYRRMGLLEEAIDLATKGVKKHPHFASGRVALGKCLVQKGEFEKAAQQLNQAVELSPENILAHQLYAECLVRLKKPVDALNAYKMVLFLNPNDTKAAKLVSRLETELFAPPKPSEEDSLTEDFSMQKLTDVANIANEVSLGQPGKGVSSDRSLERELAHLDVSLDRGDWPKAREILDDLLKKYPENEDVQQRHLHLQDLTNTSIDLEFIEPLAAPPAQNKIKRLQRALENIEYHRRA